MKVGRNAAVLKLRERPLPVWAETAERGFGGATRRRAWPRCAARAMIAADDADGACGCGSISGSLPPPAMPCGARREEWAWRQNQLARRGSTCGGYPRPDWR
jgi:hypothetical protein